MTPDAEPVAGRAPSGAAANAPTPADAPGSAAVDVAIVGGGVAGLAVAFHLRRRDPRLRLAVLERAEHAGGKVRTDRIDGYTVDWGPNGFLAAPDEMRAESRAERGGAAALARELGLGAALQFAAEAATRRYLFHRDALRPLPASPPALLRSELLSFPGKLRLLLEPLLARRLAAAAPPEGGAATPDENDESVHAFVARHFGAEAAARFAGPLVLGVSAGDPHRLSLDALFPRLRELEREHGSLLRGMAAAAKHGGRRRLASFRGGVQRLVDALAAELGGALRTGTVATALRPLPGGAAGEGGYRLRFAPAPGASGGAGELRARVVVLATPAFVSGALLRPFAPQAAALLDAIPYAPVRVLALGYHRVDVPRPLDGFGFLAARGEGLRSLGVLWSSAVFADQAPAERVLLRVIAGGSVDPGFVELDDAEAEALVRRDLQRSMGIVAVPELVAQRRWPRGIPQYELGHGARLAELERCLAPHPGLLLAGNAYRGVGVNDCADDARRLAVAAAAALAEPRKGPP